MHTAATIEEVQQAVVDLRRVHVVAGGSKPALSAQATLSVAPLRGIVEYQPDEFTFTARAGTPVAEVQRMLDEQGQFLPFDPPLAGHGATLGGSAACGLSGPGRLRYGGLRDFLLGVRLVTGEGRVVFGGGKVVKNAAGFDIPKLMVGACGQFGVLAELTFKVFPRPEAYLTIDVRRSSLAEAVELQSRIASSPLEPACLDLLPPDRLLVRIGGLASALEARLQRLLELCGGGEVLRDEQEQQLWQQARDLQWADAEASLVRVALSPGQIAEAEEALAPVECPRRYSVAGNLLWLAWPPQADAAVLDQCLQRINRNALVLRGSLPQPPPNRGGELFRAQLASVFDPQHKLAGPA